MDQVVSDKLTKYFSKCEIKDYKRGSIITHAHQDPDGVLFLVEGIVEQYDITPEGNKLTVNIFKPKTFFPMSWAINKTPNDYFYAALTDVRLKQADADKTVTFLQSNPDVTFDLLSRVYKGTEALLRRLVIAASGIAVNRLIFELVIEAYRFGKEANGGETSIVIKQSVLAERSGLARETVSRELHKLENEGLVARNNQAISFDLKRLEKRLDINV